MRKFLKICITRDLLGIDMMWIVGDEFTSRSFTEHYRDVTKGPAKERYYGRNKFKVIDYSSTRYSSSIREPIPRILNLITKAIKEQKYLPKLLLIIADDDIIRQLNLPEKCEKPELKYLHISLRTYIEQLLATKTGCRTNAKGNTSLMWHS